MRRVNAPQTGANPLNRFVDRGAPRHVEAETACDGIHFGRVERDAARSMASISRRACSMCESGARLNHRLRIQVSKAGSLRYDEPSKGRIASASST